MNDPSGLDAGWDGDHADLGDLSGLTVADFNSALTDAGMALGADGGARAAALGSGARFKKLVAALAAKGAHDPAALAAWIGRHKLGKAAFQKLSAAARRKKGSREAPMNEVERRFTPGVVELRSAADAKRIGGYASVFGKLSRNLGGFVENVEPSAFNGSRAAGWPNVVARYNHDQNMLLGTTAGRTLDLRIDSTGLWYEVLPPAARADILELVQRGDVQHSSFAFKVMPGGDEWTTTDQGYPMRSLREVQLFDVAPVVTPAYPDATAGLRSLAAHFDADLAEVRSLAEGDELRKFFVRTDTGAGAPKKPRVFGPAAAAALLARKQDPWA